MKISNAKLANGNLVNVEISNGLITKVDKATAGNVTDGIDAKSKLLIPGLVDLHTHLREPGFEQSETVLTGTQAAAMGGFTAVHAMANTSPVADTAGVVEQVAALGREAGYADVYPIGAVTVGLEDKQLAELGAMANSKAQVRVFSDDGKCVHDPVLMQRLAQSRMPLTVCPLSNLKLCVFKNLADHNLGQMLDAGLCVTINSDDPAYFGGYLNDNYLQTFAALHLNAQQAYKLAANSIEASFAPEADKHRWMHELKVCFQGFAEQD